MSHYECKQCGRYPDKCNCGSNIPISNVVTKPVLRSLYPNWSARKKAPKELIELFQEYGNNDMKPKISIKKDKKAWTLLKKQWNTIG